MAIPRKQRAHSVSRGLPRSFLFTAFRDSLAMTSKFFFAFCFLACSSKPNSSTPVPSSTKFQQYLVHGELLYTERCSNCHQKNGTGLGLLYPPLNKSDFVDTNFERAICVMKNGIEGELIVNGKSFNKKMPAIPSLTDIEVAEIATYVYNTWGRERGIVEVSDVSRILTSCDSLDVIR